MRRELYADSLDVVKWTAVVRAAESNGLSRVLHVAMLRPDAGSGEGRKAFEPARADERVQAFFAAERRRRESGARLLLQDVRRLGNELQPRLAIDVFEAPFEHAQRAAYFGAVLAQVEAPSWTPAVVFLDPDTGISRKGSNAHVRADEVVALARAVGHRGLVLAYAHRGRAETTEAFKARVEGMLHHAAGESPMTLAHHYANDGLLVSMRVRAPRGATLTVRRRTHRSGARPDAAVRVGP